MSEHWPEGLGPKKYKPNYVVRLIYWSVCKVGNQEEPYGHQDFDMTDAPLPLRSASGLRGAPGHPMYGTELSRTYERLYDDPTIYKIEIWQFVAGFDRNVPGRLQPKVEQE